MRTAAIGIGSNSLRMLVADISDGQLIRIKRYREGLRVFAALDAQKNILPQMIENACESVDAFAKEALAQGAECIHLFATSAVRDAANQQAFTDALQKRTGLSLDICSGDKEAHLSFWGACQGESSGLVDIGGGSTELALGHGQQIDDALSLQLGAVRLYREMPIANGAQAQSVVAYARQVVSPLSKRFHCQKDTAWVGVGGTFTTSAALAQRIPWQQKEKIHGYSLSQHAVKELLEYLAPMPLDERLQINCMQPRRADIVVHGIAILLACMQELCIPTITVSEYGNLEGYLRAKYLFE